VAQFDAAANMPTALLCHPEAEWSVVTKEVVEWIALTWPANAEPFFARGATSLLAPRALYEPDRPWGDFARMAVTLSTADDDEDRRRVAIDVLVEGIADGRVHPRTLGETLVRFVEPLPPKSERQAKARAYQEEHQRLREERYRAFQAQNRDGGAEFMAVDDVFNRLAAPPEPFKLNRLCECLAEVARVSPLHAWVVAGALETLLASYKSLPEDVRHVLALLLELMTQLGLAPGDKARAVIAGNKSGGKTGSLVKALAALEPKPTAAADEARVLIAERRVERAERWSRA